MMSGMSLARRALAFLALVLLAPLSAAQEPPPPPPPAPVSPSPGLDEDPHIDRVWLTPTAITQPAGSTSFNSYELVFLGITHAFTDNFQLTAVVFPPYVEDLPFLGLLNAKVSFTADERLHFALAGGLAMAHIDDETTSAGVLTAAMSLCTDAPCASIFSAFLTTGFSLTEDDSAVPLGFGASLAQRLGRHIKLVLEVATGGAFASSEVELAEGLLFTYGVRFFTGNLAGDVGLFRPILFSEEDDLPFILGFPVVTFSYRW
jgi:hypothetical protein